MAALIHWLARMLVPLGLLVMAGCGGKTHHSGQHDADGQGGQGASDALAETSGTIGGASALANAGDGGESVGTGGAPPAATGGSSSAGDDSGGAAGDGAGGQGEALPSHAVGSHVWSDSSVSILWMHSVGSYVPGNESSEFDCHFVRREDMTTEQLQALEAMVLIESDGVCAEDGWDRYSLQVDSRETGYESYTTDGCEAEAILSTEAMEEFPFASNSPCPA